MKHLEYVSGLNKCYMFSYKQIKAKMYTDVDFRVKNLSSKKAIIFCISSFGFSELRTMPDTKVLRKCLLNEIMNHFRLNMQKRKEIKQCQMHETSKSKIIAV